MSRHKDTELEDFCRRYFDENDIYGEETVYQCDHVVLSALDFIAGVGNIIGFAEFSEEE